ncbi:MAG: asparagine synthetase B, partial [Planctomycetes bacterium]|nr:asparagine synthetase B [Planctomycetota bacterium]
MCGIAGIAGECAIQHRNALKRMVEALAHRGPDGEGFYEAPSGHCLLGHRRLSILDLSSAAEQPMSCDGGRFTLSYNGECYNYRQ